MKAPMHFVCWMPTAVVVHREDRYLNNYQYVRDALSREEARRIAEAISRLPKLLTFPQC